MKYPIQAFAAYLMALGIASTSPVHAAPPEQVAAKVVALNAERSQIVLKHARIKSIDMDAMTMPFKVRDAALLKPLKVGDKVRFSVAVENDELTVTSIRRVP